MEIDQKYALITGATSGIGYELAKIFAENNYNLIIVARKHDELNHRQNELRKYGIDVIPYAKDLFNSEDAYSIYADLALKGISPEILVNDAGQGLYGKFQDTDVHREIDMVNLNITSVLILTKLFIQDRLVKGSGKILNLSSIASKSPGPWQSVYHGTKAFIQSWTEAIREELKETGISVTALLPGPTDTDFFNKADMNRSKIMEDKENFAKPADVARDGFNALMNGHDKVVSGLNNKLTVAMSNLLQIVWRRTGWEKCKNQWTKNKNIYEKSEAERQNCSDFRSRQRYRKSCSIAVGRTWRRHCNHLSQRR